MKKQFIVRSNIQALCLTLSISLSSLPAFAALTPTETSKALPTKTDKQLFKAIEKNKPKEVRRLLDEGAHLDVRDHFGNKPLHFAVVHGHEEIVQLILDKHASLETTDDQMRCTSLHRAAIANREKITYLLLSKKANIEARDYEHFTPLHHAISHDREVIVDILLNAGADKEATTKRGQKPLELAVDRVSAKSVMVMLSTGCQTDLNILSLALKNRSKWRGDTIIYMLLTQDVKPLSLEVRKLLTEHSFDLPTFEKNKERFDEYWKELIEFLKTYCTLPLVLVKLINEYHKSLELYEDLFTQPHSLSHVISYVNKIYTFPPAQSILTKCAPDG